MTPPNAAPAATTAPASTAPAAPATGTPTPPVAEPTRTIKVSGKEYKVTEKQYEALAQKGMFADQKLKSVDVLQGTTARLLADLKTPEGLIRILKDPSLGANPKEVFKKLMASDVIDDELKEAMSEWVYKNVVQTSKLTPEQLEDRKKLSDYERLKAQEDKRKSDESGAAQKAQQTQIYNAVRAEVSKQITADKGFPQTEGSIRMVIEKLRVMNKQKVPINSESIGKAIGLVKKDHIMHQQAMFDVLEDPEALIAFFGEARALKISKALVARLQAKGKVKAPAKEAPTDDPQEKMQDRIDKKYGRERHGYAVLDV